MQHYKKVLHLCDTYFDKNQMLSSTILILNQRKRNYSEVGTEKIKLLKWKKKFKIFFVPRTRSQEKYEKKKIMY